MRMLICSFSLLSDKTYAQNYNKGRSKITDKSCASYQFFILNDSSTITYRHHSMSTVSENVVFYCFIGVFSNNTNLDYGRNKYISLIMYSLFFLPGLKIKTQTRFPVWLVFGTVKITFICCLTLHNNNIKINFVSTRIPQKNESF